MPVPPRAILLAAFVLLASAPTALAGPEQCVEMILSSYASGLRLIANAGESVAFGFSSGAPGDGIGYVIIITPALCTGGGGVPLGVPSEIQGVLNGLPDLIPLP